MVEESVSTLLKTLITIVLGRHVYDPIEKAFLHCRHIVHLPFLRTVFKNDLNSRLG